MTKFFVYKQKCYKEYKLQSNNPYFYFLVKQSTLTRTHLKHLKWK
jgi:hypothetical protein